MTKPTLSKQDMYKQECDECEKIIIGWTSEQVVFLLAQHKLSCDKKSKEN